MTFILLAGLHFHIISDVPLIGFLINDLIVTIVYFRGDGDVSSSESKAEQRPSADYDRGFSAGVAHAKKESRP